MCEDFVAVFAGEGEGQLGGEEAVVEADVMAAAVEFVGEVALADGELRESVG